MLPGDSSTRCRKPSSSTSSRSVYVPPPLRKRKNSNDIKKNTSDLPQKPKLVSGRGIILNTGSSPSSSSSNSKKCENSYMLFGLEDKSQLSTPKSIDKVNQNHKISDLNTKESSNPVKKCNNSYLLFTDNCNDKVESPLSSNKLSNEIPSGKSLKSDLIDTGKKKMTNSVTEDFHTRNSWPNSILAKHDISENSLPEELSCELDSLSVGNTKGTLKPVDTPQTFTRDFSKLKPTQKKCDNSSILFEYECSENSKSSDGSSFQVSSFQDCNYSSPYSDNSLIISNPVPVNEVIDKSLDSMPADLSDNIEDYVIEIYEFPKTMRTQDLMTIFSTYTQDGFVIKWVDDTHALGVFSNPFLVSDVLKKKYDLVSVRSLQNASPASIEIASTIPIPSASRPRTCPSLARRLVSGALGLKVLVSDEIKQAEKKMLQEAKEERRLAARQREEAWEGTLSSNLGT